MNVMLASGGYPWMPGKCPKKLSATSTDNRVACFLINEYIIPFDTKNIALYNNPMKQTILPVKSISGEITIPSSKSHSPVDSL